MKANNGNMAYRNNSLEEELKKIGEFIEHGKNTKLKAETRLEELEKQLKQEEEEIMKLGYDPRTLDQDLEMVNQELNMIIEELKQMRSQM